MSRGIMSVETQVDGCCTLEVSGIGDDGNFVMQGYMFGVWWSEECLAAQFGDDQVNQWRELLLDEVDRMDFERNQHSLFDDRLAV